MLGRESKNKRQRKPSKSMPFLSLVRLFPQIVFLNTSILTGCSLIRKYDVGCRSLVYGLYYFEECSLYYHFAGCFYHKRMLQLIKCFFCIYWCDRVIFCLCFYLCDALHLLICKYCAILASLEWIPFDHGVWYF